MAIDWDSTCHCPGRQGLRREKERERERESGGNMFISSILPLSPLDAPRVVINQDISNASNSGPCLKPMLAFVPGQGQAPIHVLNLEHTSFQQTNRGLGCLLPWCQFFHCQTEEGGWRQTPKIGRTQRILGTTTNPKSIFPALSLLFDSRKQNEN